MAEPGTLEVAQLMVEAEIMAKHIETCQAEWDGCHNHRMKLQAAVDAGKDVLDAHGALFRFISENAINFPPLDDFVAELKKLGIKEGYGKRFIDAVKAAEEPI